MPNKLIYTNTSTTLPLTVENLKDSHESLGGSKMPVWRTNQNKYEVAVADGRYADGRKKYKREIADTKEEAVQRELEILRELKQLNMHLSTPQKFKEELFKDVALKWLMRKRSEVTYKTWERYNSFINDYLIPYFNNKMVDEITEDEVWNYFSSHKNSGSTLQQHHTVLKNIFKSVNVSVMGNIKRPRKNDREISCIKDPVELATFVYSFKNSILFLPVYIGAVTGMRLSEIAGLRWDDVNLKEARITVNRSLHWKKEDNIREWYVKATKNGSSMRSIKISVKDVEVLSLIKATRNANKKDFVCFDSNNNPLAAGTVSPGFKARAKVRGQEISFHSLRHSHATLLIQYYKKSINAVSKRLGHANEVTTLTIYTSILPRDDEDIADTMGELMACV